MNAKQRHKRNKVETYRETAQNHDGRLKTVEQALHNERLSKFAWRAFVGLILFLLGAWLDLLAPHLLKTRFLSFSFNEDFGLAQGFMFITGALLLLINSNLYNQERKNEQTNR